VALKIPFSKYRVPLVYGALALTVLLPLLKPGFVLTLDMVFTPHIRLPGVTTSSYLFYAVLHVLNFVVPADVLQKLVLFAILFLSGLGMYQFVEYVRGKPVTGYAAAGVYMGGALYMINPFVYSRFMAGQFAVLLGYSLLPFFARSLLVLLQRPSWRSSIALAVWAAVIGVVSIHSLGLAGILFVVGLALTLWRDRGAADRLPVVLKFAAMSVLLACAASSLWLIPLILGRSTAAQAISGFGQGDVQAFATLGGGVFGRLANVLRLQGFWVVGRPLFVMPQEHMVAWGVIVLLLWLLLAFGIRNVWHRYERFIAVWLLVSASIGVLLAIGVAGTLLDRTVPFFGGFREPHKFTGLLAFAFAFLAAEGAITVLAHYQQKGSKVRTGVAVCAVALLPIALTPTMFFGFNGQLQPRQYPTAWRDVNAQLDSDRSDFKALFLPWHLYMYYGFAGRIIASPAPAFFDKPMIVSNQPEFGHASPSMPDAQKNLLNSQILPDAPQGTHLGAGLAPLHIKYVLLDKDDDYRNYSYLDHQSDLRLIKQNDTFRLYQNMAYGGQQ